VNSEIMSESERSERGNGVGVELGAERPRRKRHGALLSVCHH
jgi:hypothetical protein